MAQYTNYTEKTEPVDTDLALIYDTPAKVNKKFTFGNLWKWIAKKIVSEGISQLETTNKTIPGAINELNSNSSFMSNQMRSYDNYMVMFNEILHFSVIGIENVFTCKVDLVESNCIIKFYKRNDNSGKMIVFRYDGITIVDGSTENLIIKHVNAG